MRSHQLPRHGFCRPKLPNSLKMVCLQRYLVDAGLAAWLVPPPVRRFFMTFYDNQLVCHIGWNGATPGRTSRDV